MFTCKNPNTKKEEFNLNKRTKIEVANEKEMDFDLQQMDSKKSKREKTIHLSTILDVFLSIVLLKL